MGVADLAKLIDAGGTCGLAVVSILLLLRLSRFAATATAALAILVERTRGLRVVTRGAGRRVTVTIDPPIGDDDAPEAMPVEFSGRVRAPPR